MAVTEFLEAVDKKKKEEEAEVSAAPVSEEVVPEAPSLFGTPAPMESVVDTVDQVAVQSPFSQTAAAATNPVAAAVDLMAQPDVLAPAPTVQAPAVQALSGKGTVLATPEAPTAAPEVKDPGIMDTITENLAASKLGKFLGGMTTYDVSPGGDVVYGSGTPVFPSLAEKTKTPAYGASNIPVPTPEVAPAVEMATPESVANFSVNGTDVVTPEAITESGQAAVAPQDQRAGSGGLISFDSGARSGQTFFADESGVGAVTPEVAQSIAAGFDKKYGTRSNGDISITDAQGQFVDPNRDMYSPEFRTPEMQANIAAGRPPNVSASDVQAAQEQAIRNRDILKQRKIKEREKQRKREKADEYERIDRTPGPRGSREKAKKEVDKRFREQERYDLEQDRLKLNTEFEQELAAQTLSTRQKEAEDLDAYRTRPAPPSAMQEKLNVINDLPISQDEKNKLIYVLVGGEDYEYPDDGRSNSEVTPSAGGTRSAIPQAAINSLLQNPSEETARYFDLKYGAGSANKIINK